MTAPAFPVVIWWSDEDACFVACAPDLPGCMAHGPTYADAAREIDAAMTLWLDVAAERGIALPTPSHPEARLAA